MMYFFLFDFLPNITNNLVSHSHPCFLSTLMLFSPFPLTSKDIEISGGVYLCSVVFSLEKKCELNLLREIVSDDQKGQYLTLVKPLNEKSFELFESFKLNRTSFLNVNLEVVSQKVYYVHFSIFAFRTKKSSEKLKNKE